MSAPHSHSHGDLDPDDRAPSKVVLCWDPRRDDAKAGLLVLPLILLARLWQLGPSRLLPPSCRYHPTCSAYAIQAWSRYGALAGSWLALKRLLRCHPWGGCGADPLP